ncbi:hypothetical protein ACHHYP_03621 [Achlya hypogyna]|uniref:Secreted protein n=1 Tax=Achlya hypogyna TaxID=1202772 RepID=A0A1V9ZR26_ACHHY|nr:hypothetical protein ACHHYP_03621 [Achlya hypogyna]
MRLGCLALSLAAAGAATLSNYDDPLAFSPVPVDDPFLDESAAAFVRDYRLKLSFHFANVTEGHIVSAEVARHELPIDEINVGGVMTPLLVDASTYRVNMLMTMHFNSAKFGGDDFVTVASAEYTCYNKTNDHETCEAESFMQNVRQAQPVANVPDYIRPTIDLATSNMYKDEEPVWTAYETQNLTTDGRMDYVRFILDGEPVPCTAAFHFNGRFARMVHLDWSCYSATYVQTKAQTLVRNGYLKLLGTGLAIVAVVVAVVVAAKRRGGPGLRILSFLASSSPPVQETPVPAGPPKSYNSMRV